MVDIKSEINTDEVYENSQPIEYYLNDNGDLEFDDFKSLVEQGRALPYGGIVSCGINTDAATGFGEWIRIVVLSEYAVENGYMFERNSNISVRIDGPTTDHITLIDRNSKKPIDRTLYKIVGSPISRLSSSSVNPQKYINLSDRYHNPGCSPAYLVRRALRFLEL